MPHEDGNAAQGYQLDDQHGVPPQWHEQPMSTRDRSWPTPYGMPERASSARTTPGRITPPGSLDSQVAVMDERLRQTIDTQQSLSDWLRLAFQRLHQLEDTGRQVIARLPSMIEARVLPAEKQIAELREQIKAAQADRPGSSWGPWLMQLIRPRLWQIALAVVYLVVAVIAKKVWGVTLDTKWLLELAKL